ASVFNPQAQTRTTWPATSLVARAYLDQLMRSKAMTADAADVISKALERADSGRSARQNAPQPEFGDLSADLERRANGTNGVDAQHFRAVAAILRSYAGRTDQ